MRFFRRQSKRDASKDYLNRMVIGLGAGLVKARAFIINEDFGPQGTMDVLATWMGQEIGKEMLDRNILTSNSTYEEIIEKMLNELNLADEISTQFTNDEARIVVKECLICPRRVGNYDLEGYTSCPVGGLIRGVINSISGKSPQLTSIDYNPAEECEVKINLQE
ncbi:MAG: hypothetical protein KAR35_08810 [Candidatus Heimdallarchaeota archaeon]|nr:hypothetical protein [Candidatus Heimdallarchaeota archaeon]MCK5049457.1 hypothetical protein [Candidatus Heimdallarchaeota archaeon]